MASPRDRHARFATLAMPQAPEPPQRNLRNFQCGSAQRIEESGGDKVEVRLFLANNKHCSRPRGSWGRGTGAGADRPGGKVKLKKQLPQVCLPWIAIRSLPSTVPLSQRPLRSFRLSCRQDALQARRFGRPCGPPCPGDCMASRITVGEVSLDSTIDH